MIREVPRSAGPKLVWGADLDERYEARVHRTAHPRQGRLTLTDVATGLVLISETVALSYGAVFGPDIGDVEAWQLRCMAVVDRLPRA